MIEKTTSIEISRLLPGIWCDADSCPQRLAAEIRERKGIIEARLDKENGIPELHL